MTDRKITHGPGCWGRGPRHYECAVREIKALRAEVAEWKRVTAARGEAEARAERLAEALREPEEREQRDEALLRQALEALELRCGTHADERKELIPALRERLGVKA